MKHLIVGFVGIIAFTDCQLLDSCGMDATIFPSPSSAHHKNANTLLVVGVRLRPTSTRLTQVP